MAEYRLYFHDASGHIKSVREFVQTDDHEATNVAREFLAGAPGELWQGGRLVRGFDAIARKAS